MRDKRNGFSIPPQISLRTVANVIRRPWWWWNFITTPKLEFASLSSTGGTDDLAEIRTVWPNKIAIKGVQNVEDAKRLADLGRRDRAVQPRWATAGPRSPVPFHLLPHVVREVGDVEVMIATGI
jgi:L-lactate dehydrogenase (cytochrome)